MRGEYYLNVGLTQHPRHRDEGVELGEENRPARQPVAVVVQVVHVATADVHGQDVLGSLLVHDVGGQVVDVATVQEEMTVLGITEGRHVASQRHRGANIAPQTPYH